MERCWGDSERSQLLIAECQGEVERLGVERIRLLDRIKEIDVDIHRVGKSPSVTCPEEFFISTTKY